MNIESLRVESASPRPQVHRPRSDDERFRRFGEELDALKGRTLASMGAEDVDYVRKLDRFSRTMEVVGRVSSTSASSP